MVTYTSGGSTGHVTIELVGGELYVRGDAMTLVGYMGLKKARATKVANRWFSMTSSAPDYQAVVAGLTISTTVSELHMVGPLSYGSNQTVNGESAIVILGKTRANQAGPGAPSMPQILYVSSHGRPLPIKVVDTYQGDVSTTYFSHWGEAIKVTVPAGAISFSSSWLQ
jgi:hypothetical protein